MRDVGTIVRGIRTPIIKEGDDLAKTVVNSVLKAAKSEHFEIEDRDVIAITEAVVGISEGNFATLDQIAKDIKNKLHNAEHIGLVFPILSRNRFAVLLSAMARSTKKITLMSSFPADEVGNDILYKDDLVKYNVNLDDLITEEEYKEKFIHFKHLFTGVNMYEVYKELVEKEGCEFEMIWSNKATDILKYTKDIICCDIHSREETKAKILKADPKANVILMSDILTESVDGSGYSPYGLLGSNRSTEERVKLFPRTGSELVNRVQQLMKNETGKTVEVMVYGDGAFRDPVGKIWELADPVVSPAYTKGLEGSPNEIKLKYFSENQFKDLHGEELQKAMKEAIREKDKELKGTMATQGTTPRRYTDLLGSLCDLTSGSGDKGTPVVLIQRYFTNYSND